MNDLLTIKNLDVTFYIDHEPIKVVEGVSFSIMPKEMLAIVGESGSGKSVTTRAILRLLPKQSCTVHAEEMHLLDIDLLALSDREYQKICGNQIAMILQDSMTSLNPLIRIESQIGECVRKAEPRLTKQQVKRRVLDLLELVQMPFPEQHLSQYPFELSGGMCQRICIAMAFAFKPHLIIADEPTTALDVTTQAEILRLMKNLQKQTNTSILLITHDLSLVARYCDRALVMYGGSIVESGTAHDLFYHSRHPYTQYLISSLPQSGYTSKTFKNLEKAVDRLFQKNKGCSFYSRCPKAMKICYKQRPIEMDHQSKHKSICWLNYLNKDAHDSSSQSQ